jgi:hypothetical protein
VRGTHSPNDFALSIDLAMSDFRKSWHPMGANGVKQTK